MDCQTIEKLQERARDVSLPSLVADAVATHVACCEACGARAKAELRMEEGLSALRAEMSELEVPENFRADLNSRLVGTLSDSAARRPVRAYLAAAAAVLAMAMLASGGFLSPHDDGIGTAGVVPTEDPSATAGLSPMPVSSEVAPLQQVDFDPSTATLLWSNDHVELVLVDPEKEEQADGDVAKTADEDAAAAILLDASSKKKRATRVDF